MFILLYNHIKSKMLPSSFLIKNRLHVERDSKFRRIVSSFGTTFRNSKWSDYSVKNVNNQSRRWLSFILNYLTLLLILIGIDFLLLNNMCFSTLLPYFTFFTDHYDMATTLKILLTEAIPVAINESVKFIIIVIFSNGPAFVSVLAEHLKYRLMYRDEVTPPKLDYSNPLLNSFVTKPSMPFDLHLLKSFYLVYNNKIFDVKPNLMSGIAPSILPTRPLYWDDNVYTEWAIVDLSNKDSIIAKSWYLENIFDESINNRFGGNFYLNNFKYTDLNTFNLNTELGFVTNSIGDQTDTLKLIRWLYKYSILHRKTLKQSHNLTLSKKLMSSGFFDSKIMTNNLWFSDTYSRLSESTLLINMIKGQWNTMYFGSLTQNTLVNKTNNNLSMYYNSFKYLSLYESSFSYFNKRAYQFLGLNNNLFNTTIVLNNNLRDSINKCDPTVDYLGFCNNLSTVIIDNNNLNPYNHIFNDDVLDSDLTNNGGDGYIRDVLPVFGEDDLFSNDLLYATFNITQSFNKPSQMFSFYDPLFLVNNDFMDDDFMSEYVDSNYYAYYNLLLEVFMMEDLDLECDNYGWIDEEFNH